MAEKPTPRFHPITSLPLIASVIDGQLEGAEVRVFSEEMEFLTIYGEQLARWRKGTATPAQRREVERLGGQVARNREVATAILELAEDLKAVTIDAILAKGDLELGLEHLAGLFPPPRRDRPPPR